MATHDADEADLFFQYDVCTNKTSRVASCPIEFSKQISGANSRGTVTKLEERKTIIYFEESSPSFSLQSFGLLNLTKRGEDFVLARRSTQ